MDGEYAWLEADLDEIRAARDLFAKYLRWRVAEVVSPVMWKPGPIHMEHFAKSVINYIKAALIFQDNVLNGEELAKLWQAGFDKLYGVFVRAAYEGVNTYRINVSVIFRDVHDRKEMQAGPTDFTFYYEADPDTLAVEISNVCGVSIEKFPKASRDQIAAPGNFAPTKRPSRFGRVTRDTRPVIDFAKKPDEFIRISSKELEAWATSLRDGSTVAAIHVRTEILAKLANNISHGTSKG